MANPPEASAEIHQLRVRDVHVHDDHLVWTRCDDGSQGDDISVDEILFSLELPESAQPQAGFIICCLKERPEEGQTQPFQLLLLATDAMPSQPAAALEQRVDRLPSHLCSHGGNQVGVVVSTKSGLGLSPAFWQTVLRPLLSVARRAFGSPAPAETAVVTQDAGSVRQFARAMRDRQAQTGPASRPGRKTVVLLSGDGGIVDLLNGYEAASDAQPPLVALLPLGTGNALFHSLHKPVASSPGPSPLVLGLRTLFLGVPADLPVFRASFSPGARIVSHAEEPAQAGGGGGGEGLGDTPATGQDAAVSSLHGAIVASYGLHASIVYESDTPAYRVHGDKRFAMVAQELLHESHAYKARLRVRHPSSPCPEQDPCSTHAYVLVAAVSNLERTFAISPASRPLDGRLYLVRFGPVGGERTMDVMAGAYDGGRHVGLRWEEDGEAVRYDEVDEVTVEVLEEEARWRKFCVDGTIVEVPPGGSMRVAKAPSSPFQILVDARVPRPT
ncbi:hypothetical protein CDD83_10864 [Cordyceps sp. RAO-2017]|nr:hypothetical protein CDD83_10864 [Cordyceps sp. RAO-2017]